MDRSTEGLSIVKKGRNNYSIVGLDRGGKVCFEIANLSKSALDKMITSFDANASVQGIDDPEVAIPRVPLIGIAKAALYWLTTGERGKVPTRPGTIRMLRTLLAQLGETDDEAMES